MATNKEIVENAYASFAAGDVPAALVAMADDIQWTEAEGFPLAGTYVGPQAVLEGVFMRLGEIGDDFAVLPEQFVADGETVVALGSYRWNQKRSFCQNSFSCAGLSAAFIFALKSATAASLLP